MISERIVQIFFLCLFVLSGQCKPETFEWIIPVLVVQSDKLLEFLPFHLQVLVPLSQVPEKKSSFITVIVES